MPDQVVITEQVTDEAFRCLLKKLPDKNGNGVIDAGGILQFVLLEEPIKGLLNELLA